MFSHLIPSEDIVPENDGKEIPERKYSYHITIHRSSPILPDSIILHENIGLGDFAIAGEIKSHRKYTVDSYQVNGNGMKYLTPHLKNFIAGIIKRFLEKLYAKPEKTKEEYETEEITKEIAMTMALSAISKTQQ